MRYPECLRKRYGNKTKRKNKLEQICPPSPKAVRWIKNNGLVKTNKTKMLAEDQKMTKGMHK